MAKKKKKKARKKGPSTAYLLRKIKTLEKQKAETGETLMQSTRQTERAEEGFSRVRRENRSLTEEIQKLEGKMTDILVDYHAAASRVLSSPAPQTHNFRVEMAIASDKDGMPDSDEGPK